MSADLPEHLLDLVRAGGRHLWVGNYPPFDFDGLVLLGCTNFRAAATLHQQYDVVWCYETPLTALSPDQYLLLLDELVRLVGPAGVLVVRYDTGFGVIPVKTWLWRRPGLTVRVRHEAVTKENMITTVFEVSRAELHLYRPGPWTFGILTQNRRKSNVVAFLKSVRDRDPDNRHEVVICGLPDPDYAFASPVYLPQHYSPELAEISRKKNDIARAATRPNLLIVHDRYVLDDNFFVGFDQYGYDFDFVTVMQRFEDGTEFPSYCRMTERGMRITPTRPIADYNSLPGAPFINGGLMGVKTHLLRQVPMNELSFWNQAEDVELSLVLMNSGLPPRFNPFSSATTVGVDKSHIKYILPADPADDPAPAPDPAPVAAPAERRPWVGYRAARRAYHAAKRRQKYAPGLLLAAVAAMQAAVLYLLLADRGR